MKKLEVVVDTLGPQNIIGFDGANLNTIEKKGGPYGCNLVIRDGANTIAVFTKWTYWRQIK